MSASTQALVSYESGCGGLSLVHQYDLCGGWGASGMARCEGSTVIAKNEPLRRELQKTPWLAGFGAIAFACALMNGRGGRKIWHFSPPPQVIFSDPVFAERTIFICHEKERRRSLVGKSLGRDVSAIFLQRSRFSLEEHDPLLSTTFCSSRCCDGFQSRPVLIRNWPSIQPGVRVPALHARINRSNPREIDRILEDS